MPKGKAKAKQRNVDTTIAAVESRKPDLVITRIFDAPRELVFKLWTDPKHVVHWWGPKFFTNPVCELDPRPGGIMRIDMQGPDGTVYPGKGTFLEVVEPERIVFTATTLDDEEGNPQLVVLHMVTFDDAEGKTKLTLQAFVVKSAPVAAFALAGMEEGWSGSLDKLADYIANVAKIS